MYERLKCLNVNFSLLRTIYVRLSVCYLNKLQNARCNDKDTCLYLSVKRRKRRQKERGKEGGPKVSRNVKE